MPALGTPRLYAVHTRSTVPIEGLRHASGENRRGEHGVIPRRRGAFARAAFFKKVQMMESRTPKHHPPSLEVIGTNYQTDRERCADGVEDQGADEASGRGVHTRVNHLFICEKCFSVTSVRSSVCLRSA